MRFSNLSVIAEESNSWTATAICIETVFDTLPLIRHHRKVIAKSSQSHRKVIAQL
jgi:hypothetical protein